MHYFVSALPVIVFLFIFPVLYSYLSKHDKYRTNSAFGFRTTKAVKNPSNWQASQRLCCYTSIILGFVQLTFTLLFKLMTSFSDDLFLILNASVFFLLLLSQCIYVNSKLD